MLPGETPREETNPSPERPVGLEIPDMVVRAIVELVQEAKEDGLDPATMDMAGYFRLGIRQKVQDYQDEARRREEAPPAGGESGSAE